VIHLRGKRQAEKEKERGAPQPSIHRSDSKL